MSPMTSERLKYQPVTLARLDDFHSLVQDDHVRRYLMDGQVFPREWSEQRVRDSISLFDRRGVGLWLAYERTSSELAGFCGFLDAPGTATRVRARRAVHRYRLRHGDGSRVDRGGASAPGFSHDSRRR